VRFRDLVGVRARGGRSYQVNMNTMRSEKTKTNTKRTPLESQDQLLNVLKIISRGGGESEIENRTFRNAERPADPWRGSAGRWVSGGSRR
jgi:hypothetical protein